MKTALPDPPRHHETAEAAEGHPPYDQQEEQLSRNERHAGQAHGIGHDRAEPRANRGERRQEEDDRADGPHAPLDQPLGDERPADIRERRPRPAPPPAAGPARRPPPAAPRWRRSAHSRPPSRVR